MLKFRRIWKSSCLTPEKERKVESPTETVIIYDDPPSPPSPEALTRPPFRRYSRKSGSKNEFEGYTNRLSYLFIIILFLCFLDDHRNQVFLANHLRPIKPGEEVARFYDYQAFNMRPLDVLYESENEAAVCYDGDISQIGQQPQSAPTANLVTNDVSLIHSNTTQEENYLNGCRSTNDIMHVENTDNVQETNTYALVTFTYVNVQGDILMHEIASSEYRQQQSNPTINFDIADLRLDDSTITQEGSISTIGLGNIENVVGQDK
nr:hypothetical protein [Tanacetum cinerariifolium]